MKKAVGLATPSPQPKPRCAADSDRCMTVDCSSPLTSRTSRTPGRSPLNTRGQQLSYNTPYDLDSSARPQKIFSPVKPFALGTPPPRSFRHLGLDNEENFSPPCPMIGSRLNPSPQAQAAQKGFFSKASGLLQRVQAASVAAAQAQGQMTPTHGGSHPFF